MLYTEMVSAKAILYKNKNTNILLNIDKAEHPIACLLYTSETLSVHKGCNARILSANIF